MNKYVKGLVSEDSEILADGSDEYRDDETVDFTWDGTVEELFTAFVKTVLMRGAAPHQYEIKNLDISVDQDGSTAIVYVHGTIYSKNIGVIKIARNKLDVNE